ncbi:MAG: hypothetical protein ACI97A_000781 [Planctomycetota bacterium]|jgi:hypothetical protein
MALERTVMQRFSSQLRMSLPKVGLFRSHACHFADDFAKQLAAKRRNGVVGRTGKIAPMKASATNVNPKYLYTVLSVFGHLGEILLNTINTRVPRRASFATHYSDGLDRMMSPSDVCTEF